MPDDDYVEVLERHLPADAPALRPGPLVTTNGEVVGEHQGFARYTIGQRRGLPGGFPEPLYVVAIRPESREVVLGTADQLVGHTVRLSRGQLAGRVRCSRETIARCRSAIAPAAVPATVVGRSDHDPESGPRGSRPGHYARAVRSAVPVRRPSPGRRGHRLTPPCPSPTGEMGRRSRVTTAARRVAALFCLGSPSLAAQQAKHPLTIDEFVTLRTVADPQISPDGQLVAYTISTPSL